MDSNPADYDEIDSNDAFALKGVFYFNKPLTAVFEANLYKGDELVMTREVRLRENVTAEALLVQMEKVRLRKEKVLAYPESNSESELRPPHSQDSLLCLTELMDVSVSTLHLSKF